MTGLIIFIAVALCGYGLYRMGKRTGSIKGFHFGLSRGRFPWRHRR